jgi:hypothetical protein
MKRTTVTYDWGGHDRGLLERVYDTLRKRSYRKYVQPLSGLGRVARREALHSGSILYWSPLRRVWHHVGYIQGVRDALNEVKRGGV